MTLDVKLLLKSSFCIFLISTIKVGLNKVLVLWCNLISLYHIIKILLVIKDLNNRRTILKILVKFHESLCQTWLYSGPSELRPKNKNSLQ